MTFVRDWAMRPERIAWNRRLPFALFIRDWNRGGL